MRQKVCEMFYQDDGRSQFALLFERCDLLSILIGDMQDILGAQANGLYNGARDIGTCKR